MRQQAVSGPHRCYHLACFMSLTDGTWSQFKTQIMRVRLFYSGFLSVVKSVKDNHIIRWFRSHLFGELLLLCLQLLQLLLGLLVVTVQHGVLLLQLQQLRLHLHLQAALFLQSRFHLLKKERKKKKNPTSEF